MKCANKYCYYEYNSECSLEENSIDMYGICVDCKYETNSDFECLKEKKDFDKNEKQEILS